jgi:hypothetical protein
MKLEFSRHIIKITQILSLIKICPVGADLFLADGRTDGLKDGHDETNSCFTRFCESD